MNKTILVIDDEIDLLQIIELQLQEYGWIVYKATNGQLALDMLETIQPDVILSDINMPTMDGLMFLQKLVDKGCDIPVIFMTGYRDVNKMQQAWQLCAFDFIDKPFVIEHLISICNSAKDCGTDYIKIARSRFKKLFNENKKDNKKDYKAS